MRSRKLMIGLTVVAVVAVLGLAIFLITQPPAAKDEATGAIGAAQRYRSEQIKEGDVAVTGDLGAPGEPVSTQDLAEMLGRVGASLRVESFKQATLEQQAALWENVAPVERVESFLRLSPSLQKQVTERMPAVERQVFEKLMAERAAAERLAADSLGRAAASLRTEAFKQATLEQQAALWEKVAPLEKVESFLRLSPSLQKQVTERMPTVERQVFENLMAERAAFEKAVAEKAVAEKAVAEKAVAEKAVAERAGQPE